MTPGTPQAEDLGPSPDRAAGIYSLLPLVPLGLLLLLLILGFQAELQLLAGPFTLAQFLWLLALALAAAAIAAFGLERPPVPPVWQPTLIRQGGSRLGQGLAALAVACAVLAGWQVQNNGSATVATISWVLGMILILAAATGRETLASLRTFARSWPGWYRTALVLAAIVALAAALRLVDLATIPGFVHNDEANDGLQARAVLAGQVPSIFTISDWSLLPMLVHAWYAIFLGVFGDSLVSQRLGSVAFGLLSILIVALLGKELFNWRAGLIAAALLAVYHFHIHFSRVGIQVISGDVAVPLTLYLLIRTLRYRSRLSAVALGISFTIDLHAYFGSRVCFIIAPIFLIFLLISMRRYDLFPFWALFTWVGLGFLVSLAPMGIYILHHWDTFVSHTSHETLFSKDPEVQTQLMALFGTKDMPYMLRTEFWRTVLTFYSTGDGGLQYGIDRPMLDPVSSSLLAPAVFYAVFRIRQSPYLLCLISLITALVVGGAITINMPYWPRLIVLLPIVALLIAAFIEAVWQELERRSWLSIPAALIALALFGAIGYGNYTWYFEYYAPGYRQKFISAPMDVGNYLRNERGISYAYGYSNGYFYMDNEVIRFLAPKVATCTLINSLDFNRCQHRSETDFVIFIFPGSEGIINTVRTRFPGGRLGKLHTYDLGQSIYVYRVGTT